jgi:hypothetical protein
LPRRQQIDFLSIDVEGLDFMVLKSNDFYKHKPMVILVEILGSDLKSIEEGEIAKSLAKYKYIVQFKTMNTVFLLTMNSIKGGLWNDKTNSNNRWRWFSRLTPLRAPSK